MILGALRERKADRNSTYDCLLLAVALFLATFVCAKVSNFVAQEAYLGQSFLGRQGGWVCLAAFILALVCAAAAKDRDNDALFFAWGFVFVTALVTALRVFLERAERSLDDDKQKQRHRLWWLAKE